ncbi:hypothetical protein CEXT_197791 [Caerostris extrusa]|uniref:Uncharacterized protein n=1 Tax=Caerostris extrusa TaxID=172846 RepID=A0AAV4TXF6_CAEEX|nr:hypothetical protein CEXT_197791 [Caerostris extrusa]
MQHYLQSDHVPIISSPLNTHPHGYWGVRLGAVKRSFMVMGGLDAICDGFFVASMVGRKVTLFLEGIIPSFVESGGVP